MIRMTIKAVGIVSLLLAIVLSLNLLVAAQENKPAPPATDKNKNSQPSTNVQDTAKTDSPATGTLSSDDRKFIMEAAHGGMMEVELGRLATEKAASADVKSFGQRMVDDHSKANQELMQLASQKGVMLPAAPDHAAMAKTTDTSTGDKTATAHDDHSGMDKDHQKMMQDHQKTLSKLNALSGADFDKAYMDMMVEDHTKDVAAFEKEAAKGGDADVKAWASSKLPTLKEHLQMARDIEAKVKGKK